MLLKRLKEEGKDQEEETDKNKKKERAIWERIIDGIYTKGTYIEPTKQINSKSKPEEDTSYAYDNLDSKYVLYYILDKNNEFGITYFDLNTLEFCVGQFKDDTMKSKFRTLITRIRPVEVVCETIHQTTSDMTKMLKSSPLPPSFFFIPSSEMLDFRDSEMIIEHYLDSTSKSGKLIHKMIETQESKLAISSLGNAIKYLESLQIVEKTVPLAKFYQYTHEGMSDGKRLKKKDNMIIDAQALENLELLEVQSKQSKTTVGSLFSFIDRCTTKFGQRLLKKWVWAPLFDENRLKARHDAVEELVNNYSLVKTFKSEFKEISDLEKYLVRIYKYSVEQESRALYVSIDMISRLNEFHLLLSQFEKCINKLNKVFGDRSEIESTRLKTLVNFAETEENKESKIKTEEVKKSKKKQKKGKEEKSQTGKPKVRFTLDSDKEDEYSDIEVDSEAEDKRKPKGILPDIRDILEQFKKIIIWKSVGNKKIPEPVKGLSEEYDNANKNVEDIK